MRALAIVALLVLASCKRGEPRPETWSGIPTNQPRTCAWSTARANSAQFGTCISGGVAFTCVYDYIENHSECARTATNTPVPIEAP